MMRSKLLGWLLGIFLGVIPSLGYPDDKETVRLQLKWEHQFQFAGYYAAVEKGFYDTMGLQVELLERDPDLPLPIELLLQGEAEYTISGAEALLDRLQGKPIVVLSAIFQHAPEIIITLSRSGIDTPQGLIGRRLMARSGAASAPLLAMLTQEGVDPQSVEWVEHSWKVQDLLDGRADALAGYSTNEPFYFQRLNVPYHVIRPTTYGIDFYGDLLLTSEKHLKQHPKEVEAFRRASLAGWQYAMAHPEEIIDLILNKYPSAKSRSHLEYEAQAIQRLMLPDLIEIGHMNPGRWQHIAQTYVDLGLASSDYSLDGFIYKNQPSHFPPWLVWGAGVGGVISLVLIVVVMALFYFNKRLTQAVDRRTQALRAINLKLQQEIEERKQIEAQQAQLTESLRKATEEAERANLAKSLFISNVSHEIRTPLNAILGVTELLDETKLNPTQKNYIAVLTSGGRSLLQLINDILDLSKIETGKLELEPDRFHLPEFIQSVAQLMAPKAHQKSLEFAVHLLPNTPSYVVADPNRLHQLLLNLIGNAVKFTQDGVIVLRVQLTQEEEQAPKLLFSVSDTGMGIGTEYHHQIFQRFERGEENSPHNGTGLGLAISQKLVELMGGTIWLESERGQGSTFHFTIPLAETQGNAPHEEPVMFFSLNDQKVLIADDTPVIRQILRDMLASLEPEIHEAENGRQALEMLSQAADSHVPYSLAFLDFHLPGFEGHDVAKAWHTVADFQRTQPILMLTSENVEEQIAMLQKAGIMFHLFKPFFQEELYSLVATILHRKQIHLALESEESAPVPELPPFRILLVEDSDVNAMLIQHYLENTDCTLVTAQDGDQAFQRFQSERFDLILMDIQMPGTDGYTATKHIREWEAQQERTPIPIVAQTAYAMSSDIERCKEAGCTYFLPKPLKKKELLDMLKLIHTSGMEGGSTWQVTSAETEGVAETEMQGNKFVVYVESDLQDFIPGYLDRQRVAIQSMETALLEDDFDTIRQLSHKMKGTGGALGLRMLSQLGQTIYQAAKNEEAYYLESHFHELKHYLSHLEIHYQ